MLSFTKKTLSLLLLFSGSLALLSGMSPDDSPNKEKKSWISRFFSRNANTVVPEGYSPKLDSRKIAPITTEDATLNGRINTPTPPLLHSITPSPLTIVNEADRQSPSIISELEILRWKYPVFDLFEQYLALDEFVFNKNASYEISLKKSTSHFPTEKELQRNTPYPEAIIESSDLATLIKSFCETYADAPREHYIQKFSVVTGSELRFIGGQSGNVHSLVRQLCELMKEGFLNEDLQITVPDNYLFFLGNYSNYGLLSTDVLALIMRLRIENPQNVIIMRGSSEELWRPENNYMKTFDAELKARYPEEASALKNQFMSAHKLLPLATFVDIAGDPSKGFIQCAHGGIIQEDAQRDLVDFLHNPNERNKKYLEHKGLFALVSGKVSGLSFSESSSTKTREEVLNYRANTNIKYIFSGTNDKKSCCKNTLAGFAEPICLLPVEEQEYHALYENPTLKPLDVPEATSLMKLAKNSVSEDEEAARLEEASDLFHEAQKISAAYNSWLQDKKFTLDSLWQKGFRLSELPPFILPVFTFNNTSSVSASYDEGYGALHVETSWEESILRYNIFRPDIFTARSMLFNDEWPSLPSSLAAEKWPQFYRHIRQGAAIALLFYPLTTYIDATGKPHVYINTDQAMNNQQLKNYIMKQAEHVALIEEKALRKATREAELDAEFTAKRKAGRNKNLYNKYYDHLLHLKLQQLDKDYVHPGDILSIVVKKFTTTFGQPAQQERISPEFKEMIRNRQHLKKMFPEQSKKTSH